MIRRRGQGSMKPEIQFTPIDLWMWSRGEVFYYFSKMGYSLTVELGVTRIRKVLKAAGHKFFPAYLWLVTKLLNEQMEFKIAEVGQLGYYNTLTPLYATFRDDDKTFSLMWTEYDNSFPAFYEAYITDQIRHGEHHGVFFSWLGVSYYLSIEEIEAMLACLGEISAEGSTLLFDYANEGIYTSEVKRVQNMIAMAATGGEPTKSCFSDQALEKLLEKYQFRIYELLTPEDVQSRYFANRSDELAAFEHINYVTAVIKP